MKKSLKNLISRYMYLITFFLVVIILVILICIQLLTEQRRAYLDATRTISQIESVLDENSKEISELEEEYKQTCIHNAKVVAQMIESDPQLIYSVDALKEVAEKVEIDEIHIFDATGRIFAGTHPEYYDLTFDSGEQIMFFKPMLEDKSLELVQDITPNTAEAKPMQYSAVWSQDGEHIIQVGMEPVNVTKATKKNELSYIFSLFRVSPDASYYAVDFATGNIIGSTELDLVGQKISQTGIDVSKMKNDANGFHTKIRGEWAFCVFEQVGDIYIGRVILTKNLYERVPATAFWISISILLVTFILAKAVVRYMNRYVVKEIGFVNNKLKSIADGNLDEKLEMESSAEFSELSTYINHMVKSLLENNNKMSYALSKTNVHIGTYEYNDRIHKVRYTEEVPHILELSLERMEELSANKGEFCEFLNTIKKNPVPDEQSTFVFGEKYIMVEEIHNSDDVFGVVVDMTSDINRRKELEKERDVDPLTGLYNRRGFENNLDQLFSKPKQLGHSAIIMIDADGLKGINDTYGHKRGDVYLKKIASIIKNFGIRNSVASRMGGDEFVLFLYDYEGEDELLKTIETLQYIQNNSTARLDENISVPLRFSMGYCMVEDEKDYRNVLNVADVNMYKNKQHRRKNAQK